MNISFPIARLLCCAVLTFATATSRADSGDRDALARLLDEFMAGASRNDPAVHDRFWAEDLVYTSSSGERFGKAAIMSGLEEPAAATVPELRYSAADVDIRLYGDTAVVAFRLLGESADGTRPVAQFFNTGTFLKRGREWRAVAWQATRIPVAPCPPDGYTRDSLMTLRGSGFSIENDADRQSLAVALLGCVGDPDPAIRDGVVYESLATWLRAGLLPVETRTALLDGLLPQLELSDPAGFRQPFAALDLSEVARTDRIEPWMTRESRQRLVDAAARYLISIRDYRGYSEAEGWRHGVAHGADLALQLALNPAMDRKALQLLLDAVAAQVAPAGAVFYTYGEPERLARPVLYAHRRGLLEASDWEQWFERISAPGPFASWDEAFSSDAGLARRHNTLAFLAALHLAAAAGTETTDQALSGLVERSVQIIQDR